MNGEKVLVTGAAGFLGSHLTDLLLRRGFHVTGVDNLSHGALDNLRNARSHPAFEFYPLDVRDIEGLRSVSRGISMVAHMAAHKIPRYGNAIDTLLINSQGTQNVLQIAVEQCAKFVLASTSDVYGKNPNIPFSEESDCVIGPSTVARWSYAVSKLNDEHLVLAYAEKYGIPVNIVRIFGSYGPRQNLTWWGGPQSVFIGAILRGEEIPIHGDGEQTRSFTYVSDTVSGIAAVMERGQSNEIFNIGNTHEICIVELAREIHRLCGRPSPLKLKFIPYDEIAGRRYEDVRRRVPDVSKVYRMLGVEATVPLEKGLRTTINWQRSLRGAELARSAAAAS